MLKLMSLTMNEHSPFYPKAATVHKIFRGGYEFSNVTECVYAKKKVSSKICADDNWAWYHPEMNTKDNM